MMGLCLQSAAGRKKIEVVLYQRQGPLLWDARASVGPVHLGFGWDRVRLVERGPF